MNAEDNVPTAEDDALLDGHVSEESAIPVLDDNDEKELQLNSD